MDAQTPTQTFLIEAADLLDGVEETLLALNDHPEDGEAINRLFRAFHTIKGSGAMFGFSAVSTFTHHVENFLDQLRQGSIRFSPELVPTILSARDHIQRLLAADQGQEPELRSAGEQIMADLRSAGATEPTVSVNVPAPAGERTACTTFEIRFRPNPSIAASGLDPTLLLDELRALGPCEVTLDAGGVPPLEQLDASLCHLAWRIRVVSDRGINAIKDVFIFSEDGAELQITPTESNPALSSATNVVAVAQPPPIDAPASCVPALSEEGDAHARDAAAATAPGTSATLGAETRLKGLREGLVRVPSSKLDQIVSLVGELVMNQSRLSQVASRHSDPELAAPVEATERLIAEMRDAVLGIRMMPIGSTFNRFKRLVYDLSRELGKDVALVTEGAETELDKTVLDQLADPLVHLIRNSVDHGIGSPAERTAAGKPAQGTIRLTATHQGSHVVVTVEDDGRGLDTDAIRAKAIERQLISPDAAVAEAEILNLVFLPGFSTAKAVTAVSGRGVGMDVVRKQIDALRGSIQLTSTRGKGTTISLVLPLTLAIIEGLLVTIEADPFIIPMSVVCENVESRREDRQRNNGRNLISVRGELVPYVHLRELFGIPGELPAIEKIVIARFGHDRVGLVVDRVLGSHQTVIQSLGRMLAGISVVSGSTILGDGRVALILDLPGLMAFAQKQCGNQAGHRALSTAA